MSPVFKSRDKAQIDEQQRRYYWSLTPHERLALAVRLNQQARLIYAANLANPPLMTDGGRILKSAAPLPRRGR
ncbi:hypothetical protein Q3A66_06990 [Hymenobacter sp. BT770]|uniref:hypothetical protein n=1 Tax=Hymenobacter sp. BT770 TaxID=2886942 RepID=UPI001D104D1E|nr:hypothetical protein [Hymenobacter sp. BT770]MCC3152736.1 hypothetical protein [Hymenobacter sp. BT770]MDO3414809.1 hypothetical protein [Hymenobacter sp. BT770]